MKDDLRSSRSITNGRLIENVASQKATSTFINDFPRA